MVFFIYSVLQVVVKVLRLENFDVLLHVENLSLTVVPHHLMNNVCAEENSDGMIQCATNQGLVAKMHLPIVN